MTFDLVVELCRESAWSVGDEIALDALPDETKRLLAHALKCRRGSIAAGRDEEGNAVSLAEAFEEGWEAAMEDVESSISRSVRWQNPYRVREPGRKT